MSSSSSSVSFSSSSSSKSSSSSSSSCSSSKSSSSSSTYITTLDPYENILDNVNKTVSGLESKAVAVLPDITTYTVNGIAFEDGDISPRNVVDDALLSYTPDAIKAGVTDVALINDLVEDCYNEGLAGIRKYADGILRNIENGISFIDDILNLPENLLMRQQARIRRLTGDVRSLVSAMDLKLQCVTESPLAPSYITKVTQISDRIEDALDLMKLDPVTGAFDTNILTGDFNPDLGLNLGDFNIKTDLLQLEIANNILTGFNKQSTVNPKKRF